MTKTAKKRKVNMPAQIRHKLMAAVSMLMVSCIMLVSTTYAWFTLSTAPEVKGITTNVGANGNLEMMLLNKDSYTSTADDLGVVSDVNDSMATQAVTAANVKWGNLVDLSDTSYGLGSIVLAPAKFNLTKSTTDGGKDQVDSSMLLAPSYGTDGRVIDVTKNTVSGKFTNDSWIYADTADAAGVRAIGTSSGVTKQLSEYRNAVAGITTNVNAAKNSAVKSLTDNGQALAGILVNHLADENATFSKNDVEALRSMITALQSANDSAGNAIKSAVKAYNLSKSDTTMTDEQVDAVIGLISETELDKFSSTTGIKMPDKAAAAITQWNNNQTSLKNASDSLNALGEKDSYNYQELSTVVNGLINQNEVEINGISDPNKDKMGEIIQAILNNNSRVTITMLAGSGIYADIATLISDYTASGIKIHVTYGNILKDAEITTTMETKVNKNQIAEIAVGDAPEATLGTGATVALGDTYGYALDFGFRTNAASSNLLLQTTGIQRVYNGENASASEKTQGQGSYMQFKTNNVKAFSVEEMRALMSAIRVAFVTPNATTNGYDMLALAALDITSKVNNADGTVTYEGGTEVGNDGLKAELKLYNYTLTDAGELQLGTAKSGDDASVITPLVQNQASKITTIVYLDGDIVDNTMVANAVTSMSGNLNLQFSSSATLVPMENTGMRNGGTGTPAGTTTTTITYKKIADANAEYTVNDTIKGTVKPGYTIYEGSDKKVYFSNDDGTTKTELTINNYNTAITVVSSGTGA